MEIYDGLILRKYGKKTKLKTRKNDRQGRDSMVKEFVMEHVFMSSILAVGVVSLLLQFVVALSLKGYVKAAANMKTTRKKLMINLKNQFETIYGMNYQVKNIDAYVDKYLLKLQFLGLPLASWEKVPFLTAGIATLVAGGEAFYGYVTKMEAGIQVEILFSYGMVLVCLFVFFHIFGIKSKKQQIHIQLVDYLENYLANRLSRTNVGKVVDTEEESQKTDEEDMEMLRSLIHEVDADKNKDVEIEAAVSAEPEESEIELLEEFVQSFLA